MRDSARPPSPTPRLVGWLVAAFVVSGPALFFLLVTPREEAAGDSPILVPVSPSPSRLAAVGLRENRDWDALPEVFALWADRAYWEGGRTYFAWWHPGSGRHDYFFEARRTATGFRFREIREPDGEVFVWDEAAADSPLRLYLPVDVGPGVKFSPPLPPAVPMRGSRPPRP